MSSKVGKLNEVYGRYSGLVTQYHSRFTGPDSYPIGNAFRELTAWKDKNIGNKSKVKDELWLEYDRRLREFEKKLTPAINRAHPDAAHLLVDLATNNLQREDPYDPRNSGR